MQKYMEMLQEIEVEVEDQIVVEILVEMNVEFQMKKAEWFLSLVEDIYELNWFSK